SSNNVEQFLNFSSDLYEVMLSNKVLGSEISLPSQVQEKIIRKVADDKWNELPKLIPYAKEVIKFLNAFGEFSKQQTYKITASYTPGITGFTVKEKKAQLKLLIENEWYENPVYDPLVNVISTCVAYNLLEIRKT